MPGSATRSTTRFLERHSSSANASVSRGRRFGAGRRDGLTEGRSLTTDPADTTAVPAVDGGSVFR